MTRKRHILYFSVAALLSALWLTACTTDDIDEPEMPQKDNTIPVEINIQYEDALSRASDNATLSVNRILILPFRKTNESLATSEPANFVPDYAAAKQIPLHSFPVTSTKLNLQATSTYRIVVLGYNRNDYNFNNPTAASRLFDIGSVSTPATLANLYVKPINPTYGVPEFFSCQCIGNMNGTAIMQVIAAVFVAAAAGYEVTMTNIFVIGLLALIASVGTPAAPGAGAVVLFTILSGLGYVNDSAILVYSLILAINRPIEMLVTSLNVIGDSATSIYVAKSENMLDIDTYNK